MTPRSTTFAGRQNGGSHGRMGGERREPWPCSDLQLKRIDRAAAVTFLEDYRRCRPPQLSPPGQIRAGF